MRIDECRKHGQFEEGGDCPHKLGSSSDERGILERNQSEERKYNGEDTRKMAESDEVLDDQLAVEKRRGGGLHVGAEKGGRLLEGQVGEAREAVGHQNQQSGPENPGGSARFGGVGRGQGQEEQDAERPEGDAEAFDHVHAHVGVQVLRGAPEGWVEMQRQQEGKVQASVHQGRRAGQRRARQEDPEDETRCGWHEREAQKRLRDGICQG